MRAVIQRVGQAKVEVEGAVVGAIGQGLLVYLGVGKDDTETDAQLMADKLVNMRIFADEAHKMNRSVVDIGGSILLVSNFTLYGDCRKGRRPSFTHAAKHEEARALYETFVSALRAEGLKVKTGVFAARMHVEIHNNGPVTLIVDTEGS